MTNELTFEETELACKLFCDLLRDTPDAHRQLEAAPSNVRAAIGIALARYSATGGKTKFKESPFK